MRLDSIRYPAKLRARIRAIRAAHGTYLAALCCAHWGIRAVHAARLMGL